MGGAILIGEIGSEVVGTVALIPLEEGTLELAKMTVSKAARERGSASRLASCARKSRGDGRAKSVLREQHHSGAGTIAL